MITKKITVGRRKTSTARCYLSSGNGKITVNKKEAKEYFKTQSQFDLILKPFKVTDTIGKFDARINVRGGGFSGQVGAIQLAVARALLRDNEELKSLLKKHDLLTRDPRMVERKKYGQPKARKRFQFSKR
ncbi:MAG TPA: 30S ribosomal protein S9 [Ignavibacteria bacterium]|nr:30S ribosomal protein S9 [Ignavibacteria bacterium]